MRTSGEVLKDFEKLRKSLFDEEISHLAFIKDGKVQILYTQKYVDKLEDQLQQKENIINELEKWLEQKKKVLMYISLMGHQQDFLIIVKQEYY